MKIISEFDDAVDFIEQVEQTANGVLLRHAPEILYLIKINNWFGSKWLGFSGKLLGAVGIWHKPDHIRIPPFVPNRVVSQRRFVAPAFEEIDSGDAVHPSISSRRALLRETAAVLPGAALVWYSGNSEETGRGSIMAYLPIHDSYWPWYVGWKRGEPWRITETWNIEREDLSGLMVQGTSNIQKE